MPCLKKQLLQWKKKCQLCLDVRPTKEYLKQHLQPSTNIPFEELPYRLGELPPKQRFPFALLTSNHPTSSLEQQLFLKERGWQPHYIFEPFKYPSFWKEAQRLGCLTTQVPLPWLLFRPHSLFLDYMSFIQSILSSQLYQKEKKDDNHDDDAHNKIKILDIGCGSGRDLTYLLLKNPSWYGVGMDYLPGAYQRFQQMTLSIPNNKNRVQFIYGKLLNNGTWIIKDKDNHHHQQQDDNLLLPIYDMIITIRFFNRTLLPLLPTLFLKPGGLMVISHFIDLPLQYDFIKGKEGEDNDFYYLSPKKEKRLYPGELNQFAKDLDLTILVDRIEYIEDGRPVHSMILQKK